MVDWIFPVIGWSIAGIIVIVLISAMETHFFYKRISSDKFGKLKFGWGILVLGLFCLLFSGLAFLGFFYDDDVWQDFGELISLVLLLLSFGISGVYLLIDYYKVYGSYDNEEIFFSSPWTGTKKEKWNELLSIKYSRYQSCYVLEFKSGKIIRLSYMLNGYAGVLEILEGKGFIIPE